MCVFVWCVRACVHACVLRYSTGYCCNECVCYSSKRDHKMDGAKNVGPATALPAGPTGPGPPPLTCNNIMYLRHVTILCTCDM